MSVYYLVSGKSQEKIFSCLRKNPTDKVGRAPRLTNTCCLESKVLGHQGSSMPICPPHLFHLSVPALYPFIINLSFGESNISLSSVSHSSSFMKSKERVIRNFRLQLVRLTCRCQPGFVSGIHNAERPDVLKLQNLMLSLSTWC